LGHRLLGPEWLQDVLWKDVAFVEEALLLECLESVFIEDLGPDVNVVARRIAAAEDVAEEVLR
jgi:hypothetical protein